MTNSRRPPIVLAVDPGEELARGDTPIAMRQLLAAAAIAAIATTSNAQGLFQDLPVDRNPLPALGTGVRTIGTGDADQDGDDDCLVAQDAEFALFRQVAGTFTRTVLESNQANLPRLAAIGDLDGDGFADLVTGGYAVGFSVILKVWWGDASGQFPTANTTSVSIPPEFGNGTMEACDVDHDGDLDLVLTKGPGLLLHSSILERNLGNRTFAEAPAAQYPLLGAGTCTVFCVDVDGDTFADVVLVSRTARTRLYWNNQGNFVEATAAQFPVLTTSLRGLAVADFDGDGDRDLAFGGDTGNGRLLLATGVRQFALGAELPTDHTVALLAGDQDGDGDVDLLAYRREQGLRLHNDGTAGFAVASVFGSNDDTQVVAQLDLDDDGDQDVLRVGVGTHLTNHPPARVTASYQVVPGVYQHVGDVRLPVSLYATSSLHGDVNGDGLADLTVLLNEPAGSNPASSLQFAANDGRGVFTYRHTPRLGNHSNGFYCDLNRDGYDEFVQTGSTTRYFGNTLGALDTVATLLPMTGDSRGGTALDADADGDAELVMAMRVNGFTQLQLFEYVAGTWVDQTASRISAPVLSGQYPGVLAADFDGDQDDDVWLYSENGQLLLRNVGGVLTHVAGAIPATIVGGSHSSCGDLDGDGDLDIHTGRYLGLNRGNGTFVDVSIRVPAISGNDTLGRLGDLDDDGDLDLLGSGLVAWNLGTAHFAGSTTQLPFGFGVGNSLVFTDADRDGDLDLLGVGSQTPPVFYTNLLRQLWLQEPARLGGSLEFHYQAKAGQVAQPILVWFACSFTKTAPSPLGDYGWVQIDPAQLIALGAFGLPQAGGEVVHHEPVPNDPALRGVFFCAQPIELRGTRWRIGNLVETWLGR